MRGRKQPLAQPGDLPQQRDAIQAVDSFGNMKAADDQGLLFLDYRLGTDIAFAHIRCGLRPWLIGKGTVLNVDDQVNLPGAIGLYHPGDHLKAGACGHRLDSGHPLAYGLDIVRAIEIDHRGLVFQGHDRGVGHHRGQAARLKGLDLGRKAINLDRRYGGRGAARHACGGPEAAALQAPVHPQLVELGAVDIDNHRVYFHQFARHIQLGDQCLIQRPAFAGVVDQHAVIAHIGLHANGVLA